MVLARALEPTGAPAPTYRSFEDVYRQQWRWDRVAWGSHCIDCYPGNCPIRVYVKDGIIFREEQPGTLPVIEEGVPDMNPMGCQKGVGWTHTLTAPERIRYPMRRIGPRGSGRWQRCSWDEALTEVADAVIDTIAKEGPE
ncbi:MAG: molybdopterin-dependent oxidoreductase, partial [Chloroflexi bacterium]|nr:molybdopterin-dependent oxidoreductase [Chloroflexota bacterium]